MRMEPREARKELKEKYTMIAMKPVIPLASSWRKGLRHSLELPRVDRQVTEVKGSEFVGTGRHSFSMKHVSRPHPNPVSCKTEKLKNPPTKTTQDQYAEVRLIHIKVCLMLLSRNCF
jgi:hypothetical protein